MREPLYRLSAGHPPPNGWCSKAFTLFKIPHLSVSTPMHHSAFHWWLKTMLKDLERDSLPGILSLQTAQRLLWADPDGSNQNEIFLIEIIFPEWGGFKNRSTVTYSFTRNTKHVSDWKILHLSWLRRQEEKRQSHCLELNAGFTYTHTYIHTHTRHNNQRL